MALIRREELAAKSRDEAASHLTPADLSREQERARKWFEAHQAKPQYGSCGERLPPEATPRPRSAQPPPL